MTTMHEKELAVQVRDFFDLLYKTEEDSSGEIFNPVNITSCRVLDSVKMENILEKMKDLSLNILNEE